MIKVLGVLVLTLMGTTLGLLFSEPRQDPNRPSTQEKATVDSLYQALSPQERIGQVFMIRAHSDKGEAYEKQVARYIEDYKVGGLCFFQGTAARQVALVNEYQTLSKTPLLIAMDAEWGPAMRFKEGVVNYPRQWMLGALTDNRIVYDFGKEIATQLKSLGVHVNFAPVLDINNNPNNPVINDRSFGEDKYNVLSKGQMYISGMQDAGVMAVGKHFPGHGDTQVDSHYDLPVLLFDTTRLQSLELFPFEMLSLTGMQGIMVAHLHIPALDNTPHLPTTLSRNVVTDLLQKKLKFEGLIFTDAMEMQGVMKHFPPGKAEVMALHAGNDIVLLPQNLPLAFRAVEKALETGELSAEEFEKKVKKILLHKIRLGVFEQKPLSPATAQQTLLRPQAHELKTKIIANAITLVRDRKEIIPLGNLQNEKYTFLSIGKSHKPLLLSQLNKFANFRHELLPSKISDSQIRQTAKNTEHDKAIVVSLYSMQKSPKNKWGVDPSVLRLLEKLQEEGRTVILVLNGSPYAASLFDTMDCLVVAYTEDDEVEKVLADLLFGTRNFQGRLPVTASAEARSNQGISTHASLYRLQYSLPEGAGIDQTLIRKLDSIGEKTISDNAAPGCVLLVAKHGKIFYHKAFGHHTPSMDRPMQKDDIFDLASITKIAATTLAVMKLYEDEKIQLDLPLSHYLEELKGTNKSKMTLEDILLHRAGLPAWIPFYKKTLAEENKESFPSKLFYSDQCDTVHCVEVAENLFLREMYLSEIWQEIIDCPVSPKKKYVYSDIGMILLEKMIERVSGLPLSLYVEENFYTPLQLRNIGFLPRERFHMEKIVPTEIDNYFRKQEIKGYVHDMGAALMGGVAGHAGLFSDALSLAILMEMLRNQGRYNDQIILQAQTVERFTTRAKNDSRRALGFDMKETQSAKTQNLTEWASNQIFGHTGFTGTATWADPDSGLVYVFLSNRTYPSMNNRQLIKGNYRVAILEEIYQHLNLPQDSQAKLQ